MYSDKLSSSGRRWNHKKDGATKKEKNVGQDKRRLRITQECKPLEMWRPVPIFSNVDCLGWPVCVHIFCNGTLMCPNKTPVSTSITFYNK